MSIEGGGGSPWNIPPLSISERPSVLTYREAYFSYLSRNRNISSGNVYWLKKYLFYTVQYMLPCNRYGNNILFVSTKIAMFKKSLVTFARNSTALINIMYGKKSIFALNVLVHLLFQDIQWSSGIEHYVMEFLDVKFRSQLFLRSSPQVTNLNLSNFVSQSLTRPCDVPVQQYELIKRNK